MFPQSPTAVHCNINYQSLNASVKFISHDAAKFNLFNPTKFIQLAISELEFQDPHKIIFRDRPGSIK